MTKAIRRCPISAAELVRLLRYDPSTGVVTNRIDRGPAKAGDIAGTPREDGRIMLSLLGFRMYLHRWIWLYCYGYLPTVEIDHQDGDWTNNRIWNLRLCVDGGLNVHNQQRAHRRNPTGLLGVYASKRRPGFRSSIMVHGKVHYLGYFRDPLKAHKAYVRAKRRLHKFGML